MKKVKFCLQSCNGNVMTHDEGISTHLANFCCNCHAVLTVLSGKKNYIHLSGLSFDISDTIHTSNATTC